MSDTEKSPASTGEARGDELSDNQLEAVAGGDLYGDVASATKVVTDTFDKAVVAATPYVDSLVKAVSNALP